MVPARSVVRARKDLEQAGGHLPFVDTALEPGFVVRRRRVWKRPRALVQHRRLGRHGAHAHVHLHALAEVDLGRGVRGGVIETLHQFTDRNDPGIGVRHGAQGLDAEQMRTLPIAQHHLVGRGVRDHGTRGGLGNVHLPDLGDPGRRGRRDDLRQVLRQELPDLDVRQQRTGKDLDGRPLVVELASDVHRVAGRPSQRILDGNETRALPDLEEEMSGVVGKIQRVRRRADRGRLRRRRGRGSGSVIRSASSGERQQDREDDERRTGRPSAAHDRSAAEARPDGESESVEDTGEREPHGCQPQAAADAGTAREQARRRSRHEERDAAQHNRSQ